MIALGYDLATHWCGWGVIDYEVEKKKVSYIDSGSFELLESAGVEGWKKEQDIVQILRFLKRHGEEKIEKYKVELVGVETAFGWDKFLSMFFARISTVIIVVSLDKCESFLVHPSTLKMHAAGNGRASKKEVQEAVGKLLDIKVKTNEKGRVISGEEDRFDALGCAIACLGYKKLDFIR
jgi:Holliday junction resolvasome RuvABC endonuclease subunit